MMYTYLAGVIKMVSRKIDIVRTPHVHGGDTRMSHIMCTVKIM